MYIYICNLKNININAENTLKRQNILTIKQTLNFQS